MLRCVEDEQEGFDMILELVLPCAPDARPQGCALGRVCVFDSYQDGHSFRLFGHLYCKPAALASQ